MKGHLNKAHCFFGQKDAPRTTSGSESSIWQVLAVHSSLSHCSLFHCSLFHCFTVHSHCSLFPWFTAQVFCSSVFLCLTGWIRDEISKDPSLGNSSQHLQARCVSASGPLICKIFLSGRRMMKCFLFKHETGVHACCGLKVHCLCSLCFCVILAWPQLLRLPRAHTLIGKC